MKGTRTTPTVTTPITPMATAPASDTHGGGP